MTNKPEPTFDRDGYPTDETLDAIEKWHHLDATGCLDFVKAAWYYQDNDFHELRPHELRMVYAPDFGEEQPKFLRLATGGWSGNEALVGALERNFVVYSLTWRLSSRGGLHIFEYPKHESERKDDDQT